MGNKQPSSIYLSFTFKSFSGNSLHDVFLFLRKNPKQHPEVVLLFLAKQLRHKIIQQLRQNQFTLKYCMALFSPWVDYPLDPYCPYLKIWQQMMGHELTWFPPLRKWFKPLRRLFPS